MKKYLAAILATLAIAVATPAHAVQGRFVGSHQTPSCHFRYLDGNPAFSKDEVRYTIRCAVRRWPVPGGYYNGIYLSGLDLALAIARRESGFNWYAANPTSSASGVYQFVSGTWSGQVSGRAELFNKQELNRSVFNARSNVMVAIRYAHGAGWGPWGM